MFTSPCSMPGYLRNGHRARRLQAQARGKWAPTHRCGLEARSGARGSQRSEEGRRGARMRMWPQRETRTDPVQLQSYYQELVPPWKEEKHPRVPSQSRRAVLAPSVAWCLPKPPRADRSVPPAPVVSRSDLRSQGLAVHLSPGPLWMLLAEEFLFIFGFLRQGLMYPRVVLRLLYSQGWF